MWRRNRTITAAASRSCSRPSEDCVQELFRDTALRWMASMAAGAVYRAHSHREPLLMAAVAGSLAAALAWAGPPGTDFAAHAYPRAAYLDHGFQLWNNFWYAG